MTVRKPLARVDHDEAAILGWLPRQYNPARALLLAVLERAYLDLLQTAKTCESVVEEAADWFAEEDGSEEFSFVWICEQLDLEPNTIRNRIAEKLEEPKVLYLQRWG